MDQLKQIRVRESFLIQFIGLTAFYITLFFFCRTIYFLETIYDSSFWYLLTHPGTSVFRPFFRTLVFSELSFSVAGFILGCLSLRNYLARTRQFLMFAFVLACWNSVLIIGHSAALYLMGARSLKLFYNETVFWLASAICISALLFRSKTILGAFDRPIGIRMLTPSRVAFGGLLCFAFISGTVGLSEWYRMPSRLVLSTETIANHVERASVVIETGDGLGSGFFIAPDLVATNFHVVEKARKKMSIRAVDKSTDFGFVEVLGSEALMDVAIIRTKQSSDYFLKLRVEDDLAIGDKVFVYGNPKGLEGTFSDGLVSRKTVRDGIDYIQITAAISEGSSGGPVLNHYGEVVGIATASLLNGQSLNLAVPAKFVGPILIKNTNFYPPLVRDQNLNHLKIADAIFGGYCQALQNAKPSDIDFLTQVKVGDLERIGLCESGGCGRVFKSDDGSVYLSVQATPTASSRILKSWNGGSELANEYLRFSEFNGLPTQHEIVSDGIHKFVTQSQDSKNDYLKITYIVFPYCQLDVRFSFPKKFSEFSDSQAVESVIREEEIKKLASALSSGNLEPLYNMAPIIKRDYIPKLLMTNIEKMMPGRQLNYWENDYMSIYQATAKGLAKRRKNIVLATCRFALAHYFERSGHTQRPASEVLAQQCLGAFELLKSSMVSYDRDQQVFYGCVISSMVVARFKFAEAEQVPDEWLVANTSKCNDTVAAYLTKASRNTASEDEEQND